MRPVRLATLLTAALLATACGKNEPGALAVDKAWVRLPAVPGRPGAGYFTLHGGATPGRLIAIESPQVQSIELHQSMKMDASDGMGAMTMAKLDGVDVPAGATVGFAPNGYHAMLFGLDPAVTAGKTLKLSLRFAKGQPISVDAKAVGAGDAAP